MDFTMDLELPTKSHNPYGLLIFYGSKIHMNYGFFMYLKSILIMDFYGMDMDLGFWNEYGFGFKFIRIHCYQVSKN